MWQGVYNHAMKLAFCLFKYFPFGGLQRDFLRIARVCLQRGHEVHVFVMDWQGATEPGLVIHTLGRHGLQNHVRCNHFAQQVAKKLSTMTFDLVVGFNKMPHLDVYYAADVCYQARIREKRGFWYRLLPRYRQWVKFEKAVFAQNKGTEILLISPLQQQAFVTYYQTAHKRFHLLPPGIDKSYQHLSDRKNIRAQVRSSFHISEEDFLLIMVGSGFKTKGLDRTLYALAALPSPIRKKTRLFVIGQDHMKPFFILAKRLKIQHHIKFLGGRPDVPRYLQAADLLVHPAYHENTGTVLLEALGAALPVLTLDTCGYAKYIEEANAGLVLASPFKQQSFNAALETMLLSKQRNVWRQNALAFAKCADIYQMPEKAADLIEHFSECRA